jgi:hypothetical protein
MTFIFGGDAVLLLSSSSLLMDGDQISLFENHPGLPHPVNKSQSIHAVNACLQQVCQLRKLGEGRSHKVAVSSSR